MSGKKAVHKYYADSLGQILGYVDEIGKAYKEDGHLKPLWFRGQEYTSYTLVPSILCPGILIRWIIARQTLYLSGRRSCSIFSLRPALWIGVNLCFPLWNLPWRHF